MVEGLAQSLELAEESNVVLKLSTLGNQLNLLRLQANYILTIVVLFIPFHVFGPEVVCSLQKLVNLVFFRYQIESELVLPHRALRRHHLWLLGIIATLTNLYPLRGAYFLITF